MNTYKVDEYVVYGINGACLITDIGTLDFAGPDKLYYSLRPVSDSRSTIFVSVDKESELRRVMSKKDAEAFLTEVRKAKPATYTPVRENCDLILKSGDVVAVSQMIKLLRNIRKENRKNHKGLNIQEERILKDAERVFFSEFAIAYDMSMDEMIVKIGDALDDC